eukprot:2906563-Rhodomonas_salina.2
MEIPDTLQPSQYYGTQEGSGAHFWYKVRQQYNFADLFDTADQGVVEGRRVKVLQSRAKRPRGIVLKSEASPPSRGVS